MSKDSIMVIKTGKRRDNVDSLQKILTEFGCIIQARIGLHEAGDVCSDKGLIILQLINGDEEIGKLRKAICEIDGIVCKTVEI